MPVEKNQRAVAAQIQNQSNPHHETAHLHHSPRRAAYVMAWPRQ
jgi:hypothetical protein